MGITLGVFKSSAAAAATPVISLSPGSLNFADTIIGSQSAQQVVTVSASDLIDNIIVTPPAGFKASLTSGSGYTSAPLTITTGAATPVYVVFDPLIEQAYSANLRFDSTGASGVSCVLTGNSLTATITLSRSSLSFANTVVGNQSAQQTFTVSGTNLLSGITITPPTGFKISLTSGSGYTSSPITIATGATTSVYVVFEPGIEQAYSATLTATSTAATTVNLTLSGNGVVPLITVGSALSFADMALLEVSSQIATTITGAYITGDITVTPPTGFKISLTSGSGYVSTPLTLPMVGATVYVVFAPTQAITYNGDISCTATGAVTKSIACSGLGKYFLDKYTGSTAAYSVIKLSAAATNCWEVVRESDSAVLNVGFGSDNIVDLSALTTFLGAGRGYLRTWYDQSTDNNNLQQQSFLTSQPLVYNVTVQTVNGKPAVFFDGTNDYLTLARDINGSNLFSALSVVKRASTSTTGLALTSGHSATTCYTTIHASNNFIYTRGLDNYLASTATDTAANQMLTSSVFNVAMGNQKQYKNTTQIASTVIVNAGNNTFTGVGRGAAGSYHTGFIQELIYYPSDKLTTMPAMQTNRIAAFGIT